jgi:hypothetical protein
MAQTVAAAKDGSADLVRQDRDGNEKAGLPICPTEAQLAKHPDMNRRPPWLHLNKRSGCCLSAYVTVQPTL